MATPAAPTGNGDVEAAISKRAPADGKTPVTQKVLSVSANLAQLLPTGSVMAYQILAPSFSNQGKCYPSNWWITLGLVVVLAASCMFFAFTDSIVHNGKVYYGLATYRRLNIFNLSKTEECQEFGDTLTELEKRRLKKQDFVHAFLTVIVFLTMAFSDVGLQNCFFPHADTDTQQLLKNLPLGMAVFSSLVFTIFPSKRNFIGCNDPNSEKNSDIANSNSEKNSDIANSNSDKKSDTANPNSDKKSDAAKTEPASSSSTAPPPTSSVCPTCHGHKLS